MDSQSPRDAFEVLGLEPSFELKLSDLDARQRELSRALHPDRHANAPAAQRREALNEAINVNEAHRALKDPLKRAEILCKRLGLGAIVETPKTMDGAFLMEIMEAREALAGAAKQKDLDAVEELADAIRKKEAGALTALKEGFARLLAASVTKAADAAEQGASLETPLAQLRYYRRFLEEAAAIEDELD